MKNDSKYIQVTKEIAAKNSCYYYYILEIWSKIQSFKNFRIDWWFELFLDSDNAQIAFQGCLRSMQLKGKAPGIRASRRCFQQSWKSWLYLWCHKDLIDSSAFLLIFIILSFFLKSMNSWYINCRTSWENPFFQDNEWSNRIQLINDDLQVIRQYMHQLM